MSIGIGRYVQITSAASGATDVRQRDIIGLLFTDNVRVPPISEDGNHMSFSSAADVLDWFGQGEEYNRASLYFGYTSQSATRPQRLAFARYVSVATAAEIFGDKEATTASVPTWVALPESDISITVGTETANLTKLDFSKVDSLSAVADVIQTALNALTDPAFAEAKVVFNSAGDLQGTFTFTSSLSAAAKVSVDTGAVAENLGWNSPNTIFSDGLNKETAVDAFTRAIQNDNNFGSFAFVQEIEDEDIVAVANANAATGVSYMYCVPIARKDDATTKAEQLNSIAGVALTYAPVATEYDEMIPMMLAAAVDYNLPNGQINYMFKDTTLSAKVKNNTDADFFDGLRVNYMGLTKTAGQIIKFNQRGILCGATNSIVDMGLYVNEIWLKSYAEALILTLMINSPSVPASAVGTAMVRNVLQVLIDGALENGVIAPGRDFDAADAAIVIQLTGDPLADQKLKTDGFVLRVWLDKQAGTNGVTEYVIRYLLVYAGNIGVRKVIGSHIVRA